MTKEAIICVDDERIILSSLGKQLKRNLGQTYNIELASSGQEVIELCAELEAEGISIALIISDQIMPKMSGDELLIKLHATYPQALKILLTGKAGANSVGNIVNAAALYRYIAKPWDETDLILTVKEALRRYGQEQKLAEQNRLLEEKNNLLKQSNEKLSQSLNILLATLEAADDGILVFDSHNNVVVFNQQFFNLWQINPNFTGQDSDYILTLISRRLDTPIVCHLPDKNNQPASNKYEILKLHNGTVLESYFQIQQLGKEEVGLVWGFRDVTIKEKEKAIAKHRASHDTLTKLPKRSIITYQLSKAITKAKKNSHMLGIMFINLNSFKKINKALGHKTGDFILQQVSKRLKKYIRREDMIARWSNDEFTLLLPKIQSSDETTAISKMILAGFKEPFIVKNKKIYITLNIGITTYPEHGTDAETLLKNADSALSQTQQSNKENYQYYNPNLFSQAQKLLTIENLLHSALNNNEFVLYYQPIVNVFTGKIAKMEALLRWNNPQLGLVLPSTFIPLAEENGSIINIGKWVLKAACAQNKAWQNMGLSPIKISVNLSVRQFHEGTLVATIVDVLEKTKLNPSNLELEVTESATIQDLELAKTIFMQLKQIGISLAMDDFGTGYSSLSYLKKFPFNTLKIDSSFLKDLHCDSQDVAIVNAVINLGKGLNLDVVAEGVETKELQDLLKNLGCEYIQGYLFSKPLPVDEATKLLKKYNHS